jgi:DNA-binding transcriptional LysR family regulator
MPTIISRFRETHPDIKIILDEGSSAEVSRSLLDLRNELAVIAMPEAMKGVEFFPFRLEEVVLITSPRHPFTRTDGIEFNELSGQLIVMKEVGSGTHALIKSVFEERGLVPNILLETSNQEFIKEMVERGEGVAFLVRAAIQEDLARGRLAAVPILDRQLSFQVHIAHLTGADLSPAARAFLTILEAERDRV